MDKLTRFYLNLATDAKLQAKFNLGSCEDEIRINRQKLLMDAGVENAEDIAKLSQHALQTRIQQHLSDKKDEYKDLDKNKTNSNTDNNVSWLGR